MAHAMLFRAYCFHPTVLCRLENGRIGHLPPNADRDRFPEIVICVADAGSTEAVLFANCEDERSIGLNGEDWSAVLFPMRRLRLDGSSICALAHPYSGLLLSALPEPEADDGWPCAITRWREAGGWETFRLEEVTGEQLRSKRRAEQAMQMLCPHSGSQLRTLLELGRPSAQSEAVARLMPQREYEWLAQAMMSDQALARVALACTEADVLAVGLRNLLATRPEAPQGAVDRRNDGRFASLSRKRAHGAYASFAHKLTATARRQRAPRRALCALATARDEGPYLLEWIAYHRVLGIEHFFIASNDCQDGSDALLGALDAAGEITWTENTGSIHNAQAKAYSHALTILPEILDYEWAAVLDIDEFISLRPGSFGRLADYVAWQSNQPVDVIALCWAVYWSNGNVLWSEELTTARFARQNTRSSLFKSLIRPRKFTYAYPHHPDASDASSPVVMRDAVGAVLHFERGELTSHSIAAPVYGDAWVNHYFTRSAEEFLWKLSRNRGTEARASPFAEIPENFMAEFVQRHGAGAFEVPDAVAGHIPAVREEMARLNSLPGVQAAQDEVLRLRREQAGRTRDIVAAIDRRGLPDSHEAFLRLLERADQAQSLAAR